jgi:protease-4
MFRRIGFVVILLLISAPAGAQDAPSPATAPSASSRFPTPSELLEQMKQRREKTAGQTKVAFIDIDSAITEKAPGFSLFADADHQTLHNLLQRLTKAREDDSVKAVLLTLGADAEVNLAQAQEIRQKLAALKSAGKKTFVYADAYDTVGYSIAAGATDVCLPQGGEIMIPGVGMETMYYKGTFDKLGVSADYIQIGEYKGAEEPYTRTAASDQLKGELTRLADAMYGQIVEGIRSGRDLPEQTVRGMIDDAMMSARSAKDKGFVDHLVEQDGLRDLLKQSLGNDINLVRNYGEEETPELDLSNPLILLAEIGRKPEPSEKPEVALIQAEGVIADGDGGTSPLGESGVGSDTMRRDLRIASRDKNIKAIVLRIDSPGGSALASEMIWQAVRRVHDEAKKPVIVSIGSMAASGGYYIATSGDYIFADRAAIVGSIGVVGGKFVLKDLYDKLGLTTETYAHGQNADLFSSTTKFTERQRKMMRAWMQETYDQFTQRVMSTRSGKIKDIDQVARGRIFLAQQARELGMVDALGGCDDAIAYAAKEAGLEPGAYDVRVLPAPTSLAELLTGRDPEAAMHLRPSVTLSADAALLALPADVKHLVSQQLQMVRLLEARPVVLMSPFVVRVK